MVYQNVLPNIMYPHFLTLEPVICTVHIYHMTTRCQVMSFHKPLCSNMLEFKFVLFVFVRVKKLSEKWKLRGKKWMNKKINFLSSKENYAQEQKYKILFNSSLLHVYLLLIGQPAER